MALGVRLETNNTLHSDRDRQKEAEGSLARRWVVTISKPLVFLSFNAYD